MADQENVRIVKDAYAAFSRGDIESAARACSENVEWIVPGAAWVPVAGRFRGRAEVMGFFRSLDEHQSAERFEPREFFAQGDKVAVLGHYRWTIKRTGRVYECDWVHVFTVRDGKVVRFHEFADTAAEAEAYR